MKRFSKTVSQRFHLYVIACKAFDQLQRLISFFKLLGLMIKLTEISFAFFALRTILIRT